MVCQRSDRIRRHADCRPAHRASRNFIPCACCVAASPVIHHSPDRLLLRRLRRPGQLDRSKWNVIVTGRTVNNEQQAYVDSPETIALVRGAEAAGAENGALVIRGRDIRPGFKTPEGRTFDFISGRLESRRKFEFTYGTASARIKLTAGAGLWPAFWTLGTGRWPDTGEMDMMENVGEPAWTNFALHGPGYSGNTPLVNRRRSRRGDITGWHVYSMDWTTDGFVFKVDGAEELSRHPRDGRERTAAGRTTTRSISS